MKNTPERSKQAASTVAQVPRKTIICIASGPSLSQEDVDYCRGRANEVIVVNDGYRIAPWADCHYACDFAWWRYHIASVQRDFKGECWTRDPDAAEQFTLHLIHSAPEPGLSTDSRVIHEGENSGYQAINFAFHRGADRILLLGYDMCGTGHWFGRHPSPLVDCMDFRTRVPHFAQLAVDLLAAGVEVVNCSRTTALDMFQRMTLEEALP